MTKTTRRGAIATIAAAATVVVVPAYATDGDLFALIGEFQRLYAEFNAAREECASERERVDALPDCPPMIAPAFDLAAWERHTAFWKAHGLDQRYDRSNALHTRLALICNKVFATPAQTNRGALEKLKIVYMAIGNHDGDIDLDACQPDSAPYWFETAIADLERIGGVS